MLNKIVIGAAGGIIGTVLVMNYIQQQDGSPRVKDFVTTLPDNQIEVPSDLAAPIETVEDLPLEAGVDIYQSEKLGIKFHYHPSPAAGINLTVTDMGNEVYVHQTGQDPVLGQLIKVLPKPADMSLTGRIQTKLLEGYPAGDCQAREIFRPADHRPASYVYAEVTGPNCPAAFANNPRQIQYFMANQAVPTKYVFVRLEPAWAAWAVSLRLESF